MIKNSKQKNFYLLVIIILFLILNNFFYNFYYILKENHKNRMNYHYGNCYKNGYGFLETIHSKYKINKNIPILNSLITPSSEWFFYNSKRETDKNKLILLNYYINESSSNLLEININNFEGNYKIIEKLENCYYLEKSND